MASVSRTFGARAEASFRLSIPDSRLTTANPLPRPRLWKVCKVRSLPAPAGNDLRLDDLPQIGQTTWVAVMVASFTVP